MDTFDVYLDNDLRLVKVFLKGEISESDSAEIITTARGLAYDHQYNILYDARESIAKLPFTGWYRLPRDLEVFKKIEAQKTKAAVLISPADKNIQGFRFYETVTYNLGFQIRIFFEEAEALAWLASP